MIFGPHTTYLFYENINNFFSPDCRCSNYWRESWTSIFLILVVHIYHYYHCYLIHFNNNIYNCWLYACRQFFLCCMWIENKVVCICKSLSILFLSQYQSKHLDVCLIMSACQAKYCTLKKQIISSDHHLIMISCPQSWTEDR